MAAKKKATPKKKAAPKRVIDLSSRTLNFDDDFTPKEQKDAVALYSTLTENMSGNLAALAASNTSKHPTQVSARKRHAAASEQAINRPTSMEDLVNRRVDAFMGAASGPRRLPTEAIAGEGFYFENRRAIDELSKAHPVEGISIRQKADAAAKLSKRTKPEAEKAALGGLFDAHSKGIVNFTPELVSTLNQHGTDVPKELHGSVTPFSKVPAPLVRTLLNVSLEDQVLPHVTNVPLGEIRKTSTVNNAVEAHEVLQGKRSSSPAINPKQFNYGQTHELAVPDSPEHGEYMMRAMHIGMVARGESTGADQMLDFYNLRDSNEGILSNRAPTVEDTWMNAVSYDQPSKIKKASGDVYLTKKTGTTKRGRALEVGKGVANVTYLGIQHAVNQAATHRAAAEIQRQLNLSYTVPAPLVQEADWAETRRSTGRDAQYNAAVRASTSKQPKPRKEKPQPGLFD